MTRVLGELIPDYARAFLDDITVRGPTTTYGGQDMPGLPGVRRYIGEHLQSIDKVLVNVELAHCTIKAYKSH